LLVCVFINTSSFVVSRVVKVIFNLFLFAFLFFFYYFFFLFYFFEFDWCVGVVRLGCCLFFAMETKTENLFALILSRESGFVGANTLEPLVLPFVEHNMTGWLLETVTSLLAAEFSRRTLPTFWKAVETKQLGVEGLRAGLFHVIEDLDVYEGKLQSLAGALGVREYSASEVVVPLLFRDTPGLRALLLDFAVEFLKAFETRSQQQIHPFDAVLAWLERLNLKKLLFDSAIKAVEKAVDEKLGEAAKNWDTPCLSRLLNWVKDHALVWISVLSKGDAKLSQRVWREVLENFCMLRSNEMFDIIVGFPEETLVAVNDLKDCLAHLMALHGGSAVFGKLQTVLSILLRTRLLHPGANTADIIRTYILCIHVLRVIDPSGVALDRVSGPVRAYLVGRPDTIRCIVQSLTDPAGDLFSELSKERDELQARRATNPEFWVPEPGDSLPQSEGVSRHKDVVELLINIFGGTEPFVAEFKKLMGQRLLSAVDYNVDSELRTLELLKLRFGDASFNDCEIMLRDIADSKRVNKLCLSRDVGLEDFSAVMMSYLYWPANVLQTGNVIVPSSSLQTMLNKYQANFAQVKASRKLEWNLALGEVDLDVTLPSGRTIVLDGLSFLQATVLELFQQQATWTADDLVKRTLAER
jgi:hypothetical protein